MRIDPIERALLQARALDRWLDSKTLRREISARGKRARDHSGTLCEHAEALRERTDDVMARSARLVEESVGLRGPGSSTLEVLADRVIRSWRPPNNDPTALDGGAALIATSSMGELLRFKELAASSIPFVMGATDAGTALGLAIVMQPDLALIDTRLELASGTDLALTFPLYSPQAKTLVLTDDASRAHDLRLVGLDSLPRGADDSTLLGWIERAA